jgi:hypothetical protein
LRHAIQRTQLRLEQLARLSRTVVVKMSQLHGRRRKKLL